MASDDFDLINQSLEDCDLTVLPIDLLNELLLSDQHHQHQRVARALQLAGDPSTVAFVATSLRRSFDRLAYTASEDAVIVKWHSWVLADIGTVDAVQLIREYAESANPEIAKAMRYRLNRLSTK